jgi:hypothetical protein
MIILFVAIWIAIIYAIITVPTDVELWGEEIE